MPRLAGRESGKRSGAAEEARDHCFGVHEERGFRAPPKRAPETGARHGYQCRHQRWAGDAKAAAAATKKPVCKHRSLSTPPRLPQEPVQPATARVPRSRATSLGERTARLRLVQCPAGLCLRRLALHSVPLPPPHLIEPEPPNQLLL